LKAQYRSYAPGYGGRHILGSSRRAWSGEASDNPDVLDEVYTPDALWHLPEQDIRSGEIKEFGPPNGRQMEQKGMSISRIEGGKIVEELKHCVNTTPLDVTRL
jgi:hypothetical protein